MRLGSLTATASSGGSLYERGDSGQAQADDGKREDRRVFTGMLGVELHCAVLQAAQERGDAQEEQGIADNDAGD